MVDEHSGQHKSSLTFLSLVDLESNLSFLQGISDISISFCVEPHRVRLLSTLTD